MSDGISRLIDVAKLHGISLKNSRVAMAEGCNWRDMHQDGILMQVVELPEKKSLALASNADGEQLLLIDYPFGLRFVSHQGEEGASRVLAEIEAIFEVEFILNPNAPEDDVILSQFAAQVGILHVWPYWREFVQSMSVRMNWPPVILPMFKRRFKPAIEP